MQSFKPSAPKYKSSCTEKLWKANCFKKLSVLKNFPEIQENHHALSPILV